MITEAEELDVKEPVLGGGFTKAIPETTEEAAEGVPGGKEKDFLCGMTEDAPCETMEDFPCETMEDSPCETVEEPPGRAVEEPPGKTARRKKRPPHKGKNSGGRIQRPQIRRMCEWLLPYGIAAALIIGAGSAVLLVSHMGTQQLGRQLLEQYGEYFTDE